MNFHECKIVKNKCSGGKTAYSKRKSCPRNLLLAVAGHRVGIEAHNRSYEVTVNRSEVD